MIEGAWAVQAAAGQTPGSSSECDSSSHLLLYCSIAASYSAYMYRTMEPMVMKM